MYTKVYMNRMLYLPPLEQFSTVILLPCLSNFAGPKKKKGRVIDSFCNVIDVMGAAALPDDCSIAHRTLSANKSKNQPLNSSCAPEFVKGQAGAQLSSLLAVNNIFLFLFFLFFSPNFLCTTDIRSIKFRCPCPTFCVFTMMKRWKIK